MSRHLVVAGAQRCGTTYLADLLVRHPDVALAEPRRPEPKVFLDNEVVRRGADWYVETYFQHASHGQLLAEKSTSYLDHEESLTRMTTVLDDLRVIVQLRDPVERAVSHWRFSSDHGVETRPLAQALEESIREESEWDRERFSVSPFAYLSRGDYAAALGPWVRHLGERLRIQFLEEVGGSHRHVSEMFAWLGLSSVPDAPGAAVNDSPGARPDLPAALTDQLREHFAPSERRLRDLVGRALPWDGSDRPR